MKLKKVTFKAGLPGVDVGAEWGVDGAQEKAIWRLYVQLVTRIAVAELEREQGLLREALASYHAVFLATRDLLIEAGPDIARPRTGLDCSLGYLVLWMLNGGIRPLLAEWHPRLSDHEAGRPEGMSSVAHEQAWADAPALRARLSETGELMTRYARVFEAVLAIPSMIPGAPEPGITVTEMDEPAL